MGKRQLARKNLGHGQIPMYIGTHATQYGTHPRVPGCAVRLKTVAENGESDLGKRPRAPSSVPLDRGRNPR